MRKRSSVLATAVLSALGLVHSGISSADPAPQDRDQGAQTREKEQKRQFRSTFRDIKRATELVGWDVKNSQGEELGEIEEIVLNVETGEIAYAVLAHGGVLGIGEKLVAVPWNELKMQPEKEEFLLNVTKEKIESAAGLDEDRLPREATPLVAGDTGRAAGAAGRPDFENSRQGRDVQNAGAQGEQNASPLKIQVEKGQELTFAVEATSAREGERNPSPFGRSRTGDDESESENSGLRTGRDQARGAAGLDDDRDEGAGRRPLVGAAGSEKPWCDGNNYKFVVQDVSSGGEVTLQLTIEEGKDEDAQTGRERFRARAEEQREEQRGLRGEEERSRQGESALESSHHEGGTYTVVLAPDGQIKSVKKSMTRGSEQGTTPGQTERERQPLGGARDQARGFGQANGSMEKLPKELATHFRLIFAPGLHQQQLTAGEMYNLESLYQGETAGAGARPFGGQERGQGGQDRSPGRSVEGTTGGDQTAKSGQGFGHEAMNEEMNELRFRFIGKTSEGGKDVARFVVLARNTAEGFPANPRGLRAGERETPRARGGGPQETDNDRAGLASPEWRSIGMASYNVEDGLLYKVRISGLRAAHSGFESSTHDATPGAQGRSTDRPIGGAAGDAPAIGDEPFGRGARERETDAQSALEKAFYDLVIERKSE